MSKGEVLARRIRQVMAKVHTEQPTTAEDVHMAAVAWAVAEQKGEAADGTTTGADLFLLRIIRAQGGAGDASAQAICDAAVQWRTSTTLTDDDGSLRRLLAQAVDLHLRPHRRRRLLRAAFAAMLVTGIGLAIDGTMMIEEVPAGPVRAVGPTITLIGFVSFLVLMWLHGRPMRR